MSLRPSEREQARRSVYKVAVDADEGRRRREVNLVQIRRTRREESLLNKRRQHLPENDVDERLDLLPTMVAGVYSNDDALHLESMMQFRKLVSAEDCPPIDEIIQAGVVPRFVEFLIREDHPKLQFEAAWTLANILCGSSENTNAVIEHGAVPIFVKLIGSPSDDVCEQALVALANVAGDSPMCRDIVLSNGALLSLSMKLQKNVKLSMLRNVSWALSSFCRGKPPPASDQVKSALNALRELIQLDDEHVLTYACWALSYLSDGTSDQIQAVLEAGVCHRLVELLMNPSPSVVISALRTIGNIVTGDDSQTQFILDLQPFSCLRRFLVQNYNRSIQKEACRAISNITAGNKNQIQAVIKADIIPLLVCLLQTTEFDIKKQVARAICNVTSGGDPLQLLYLVNQGCIKPLCDLLACPDPSIVKVCLKGLEQILKVWKAIEHCGYPDNVNPYAQMIEDAGGFEKIEALQSHDNSEIYDMSVNILEAYYPEEKDGMHVADFY